MKVTINLRPTIALERPASRGYFVTLGIMVGLPVVALAAVLYGLWRAEVGERAVLLRLAEAEAKTRTLQLDIRKEGFPPSQQAALADRARRLAQVRLPARPATCDVFARLEEVFPNDARTTALELERGRSGPGADLRLMGEARTTEAIASLLDELQSAYSGTINLETARRRSKTDSWSFKLVGRGLVPLSKESSPATTATTTSEGGGQ